MHGPQGQGKPHHHQIREKMTQVPCETANQLLWGTGNWGRDCREFPGCGFGEGDVQGLREQYCE